MTDPSWEKILPDLRFGLRASAVGLVLAYALVIPLKWADLMPDHMTWLKTLVAPVVPFSLLGSLFALPLLFQNRWWLWAAYLWGYFLFWVLVFGLLNW